MRCPDHFKGICRTITHRGPCRNISRGSNTIHITELYFKCAGSLFYHISGISHFCTQTNKSSAA